MKNVLLFSVVLLATISCEKDCEPCEQKTSTNFTYMGKDYNINLPLIPEDTVNFHGIIKEYLISQGNNNPEWNSLIDGYTNISDEISGKLHESSNDIFSGVTYYYDCIYGMGMSSDYTMYIYNTLTPKIIISLNNREDLGESSFVYNLFTEYLRVNYNTPLIINGHEINVTHDEQNRITLLNYVINEPIDISKSDTIYIAR